MLLSLNIRNVLLIEQANLTFKDGLNVITGETGAGKSILLDTLGFVLGNRGRADMVRPGADFGETIAEFTIKDDHVVNEILSEAGFEPTQELVLRRTNQQDGKKQGFINDRRVSADLLRRVGKELIEYHGQNDDQGLAKSNEHIGLLDQFGSYNTELDACHTAWSNMRRIEKTLNSLIAKEEEAVEQLEYLQHSYDELSKLAPVPGEIEQLEQRRRLAKSSQELAEVVAKAEHAMGRENAEGYLLDGYKWLETIAAKADGQLSETMTNLEEAQRFLAEAQASLEDFTNQLELDPNALEILEDRLFALKDLARKHRVNVDELPTLIERFKHDLSKISEYETDKSILECQLSKASELYESTAKKITKKRQGAAKIFETMMLEELKPLKLGQAQFKIDIQPNPASKHGRDQVQFLISTNPGLPLGPINKVASGGELSRFSLALKVCMSASGQDATMIFDEIDAGVGGATADAVGVRLAKLGVEGQVLIVTHSPQVAAKSNQHWLISKTSNKTQSNTEITELDALAKQAEIARMISGDSITDAALTAAKSLIKGS